MEASYRMPLANPAAMQQYSGLKYTDDHSEARHTGARCSVKRLRELTK